MKFNNFNFKDFIKQTLVQLAFEELTPVQEKTIPLLLKNNNIIVQSKTGTGKTLAYLLPTLNKIDFTSNEIQALIFLPTRDLGLQTNNILKSFMKNNSNLKGKNIVGGNMNFNNSKPQIIFGTPSKIKQLLDEGNIKLNNLKSVIFDEFDMIYELNFLADINYLLSKIKNNQEINYSAFSATIPQEVETFFKKNITNPKFVNLINDNTIINKNVEHYLVQTKHKKNEVILEYLLKTINPYLCMIFVNTKKEIDSAYDFLIDSGYKACKITGEMQTRQRKQIFKKIQKLEYNFIVATDLMARGIDIDGISHVISLTIPKDLLYYVHRSGRTGRHKNKGYSYLFYNNDDINKINELKKMNLEFKNLVLQNNNLIEKVINNNKKSNEKDESNKKFNYKKRMVYEKFTKVKPNYKNKRKKNLKKLKKR